MWKLLLLSSTLAIYACGSAFFHEKSRSTILETNPHSGDAIPIQEGSAAPRPTESPDTREDTTAQTKPEACPEPSITISLPCIKPDGTLYDPSKAPQKPKTDDAMNPKNQPGQNN